MDDATREAAARGPLDLFEHLWGTKYVPALNEEIAAEAARRSDAFFDDVCFTCCGEELRVMTPTDLHWLDGIDNCFVAGGAEPTEDDVAVFLWSLHAHNQPKRVLRTAFRRGRFKARLTQWLAFNGLDEGVLEIFRYLDRVFIDLPDGQGKKNEERKPPTVHCIAPLLVNVAAFIGPTDPMNGRYLGLTPIPRLIQYQHAGEQRTATKQGYTVVDSWKTRCMAEVNEVIGRLRAEKK